MWPTRPEMTRDDCRKCLRCLELDAYGSMVSVLRAQGPFTSEKQKLLQELAKVLHISNERHRAEVRRAVNDEKLATIAEQLNGPNTGTDWTIEGRRTIPLLPRLKARSAFTTLANSLSLATAVANEKKLDRHVTSGWSANSTAVETESQLKVKAEEDSSVNTKLCSPENELDNNKILQETSNLVKHQKIDNNDIERVEKLKVSKIPEKRKSPSPLSMAPPNKVLVVSPSSPEALNHIIVDKAITESDVQAPQVTHHQNVKLIPFTVSEISDSKETTLISADPGGRALVPSNKHINTTISVCENNANKPKTLLSTMQNKVSTKVVPIVASSGASNTLNKMQSENKDVQPQDNKSNAHKTQTENASSNLSCVKRVAPTVHTNSIPVVSRSVISSNTHRIMAVHPGTTVSSGPGPPQVKQASPILAYKKWPTVQTATITPQSTAKMSVTINSKKAVNIPHQSNTKLTTKTNVIVIQKGNAKGITLSHAGKEVLGKVIMGGKNLCVTSQHNASSVSVLPHHISLNGDQTTTTLPIANPPNAESVKTNVKAGNTIVFNLRQDVLEKNKVLSQRFDSSSVLNSETKTVKAKFWDSSPGKYTRFFVRECDANSDANAIDKEELSLKTTDSVITSTRESKQQRKNKDANVSMNSQVINPLDSSKALGIKEILVKSRQQLPSIQDDAGDDIRREDIDEVADGATLESTDTNFEDLQYLETVTVNHVDEHDEDS